MKVDDVLARLENVRPDSSGWNARCPAHDDNKNSLHITIGTNGKILLHCHAGCPLPDILNAAQLNLADLGSSGTTTPKPPSRFGKIVKAYDYTTKENVLICQALRDENKNFMYRRPSHKEPPADLWIYDLDGVDRVLYRMPEVHAAHQLGQRIYIVEGEKDADTIAALGLTGTTTIGGASAPWQAQYTAALAGAADVVIIPDNDDPGRKHAEKIRDAIANHVQALRILNLPGLRDKEDVSDWAARGGTQQELEHLADNTEPFTPPVRRLVAASVSLGHLLTEQITKPKSLLGGGLLSAGDLGILYGKPGIGKTWLALELLLAAAAGTGMLGIEPPEHGPIRVGLLELELGGFWLQQRARSVLNGHADAGALDRVQIVARPKFRGAIDLKGDDWLAVVRWIQDYGLDLIMIDALSRSHSAKENVAEEMAIVLGHLDEIRHETGAAVVPIHHEPKNLDDQVDDLDALRGSSRLQSDPTTAIRMVRRYRYPEFVELRFPKPGNAPPRAPVWMRREHDHFVVTDSPIADKGQNIEKVRQALIEAGSVGLTTTELAAKVGLKEVTLQGAKGHLATLGAERNGAQYAVQDARGRSKNHNRWTLTPKEPNQQQYIDLQ